MAAVDAIEWFMKKNDSEITDIFHYLFDHLLIGNSHSIQCESDLEQFLAIVEWLRVPVASEKLEGPTTHFFNLRHQTKPTADAHRVAGGNKNPGDEQLGKSHARSKNFNFQAPTHIQGSAPR